MRHFLIRFVVFLCVLGASAEAFFRWVVPARESPIAKQETDFKLMQYDPEASSTGLFTSGRWAEQRSRWRINKMGWNSEVEYEDNTSKGRPVVAITGDSQIEGFHVELDEHVIRQTQLQSGDTVLGYSFGVAGYKLVEYIQVARYLAHHKIEPSVFVMYINRGDIWRSVLNLGGRAGTPSPRLSVDGGIVRFVAAELYRPPRVRRLFRWSALARYLVFNARLNPFQGGAAELGMTQRTTYPEEQAHQNPIYAQVVAYTLQEVRKALPSTQVAFLVDADRRTIEKGRPAKPIGTSRVIQSQCTSPWCTHLDLTKTFEAAWRADKKSFSFVKNYHWNAYAHATAGRALYSRLSSLGWVPSKNTQKR